MRSLNKTLISALMFTGAVAAYVLLPLYETATKMSGFDWLIFRATKYQWSSASLDIHFYVTVLTPIVLLVASVLFGVVAIREKTNRIMPTVLTLLSGAMLLMLLASALPIWA